METGTQVAAGCPKPRRSGQHCRAQSSCSFPESFCSTLPLLLGLSFSVATVVDIGMQVLAARCLPKWTAVPQPAVFGAALQLDQRKVSLAFALAVAEWWRCRLILTARHLIADIWGACCMPCW